jgi:ribonucleoside-diphosphate reductase alpha chain
VIKEVIKADGSIEKFDLDKLSKWAKYASKVGGDWSELAIETFTKLPELCHSKDIHQAMIDVCYSKQDLVYSRVASRLETAQLRKNIERQLGIKVNKASFKEIRDALINKGVWCKDTIPAYSLQQEELFEELKHIHLESWQVSQWVDKYLLKINGVTVETPAIAAIGIGLGLHGDTQDAYDLARDIIYSRTNLPTPVLNGIRNGDFNGVSCCVISAGDSVESIEVTQHLAVRMTAKKAGIGVEFTTRSKGSDVKGGRIKHLGKHPIYKHTDSGVKEFLQETRGGSATVGFTCIDPEVYNIALWKSQRIDIEQRLDRLDYSFIFNDAFLDAVVNRKDWYLFDYNDAKHLYKAFYVSDVETYNKTVSQLVADGVKHTKVQALDLIKHILMIRQETGRMYFFNVSRANTHTPFLDVIKLSNLCQEICLPTKPYENMEDLYLDNGCESETAFCSLGALVPVNIKDDMEYQRVAYTLVKTINKLIVKCPKMTKNHERTMLERMSLGVGITGLAEYLYKQGYDYDGSESSLEFVSDLAEKHCFYLYKASQKLSEETGVEAKGVDLKWLPVDTKLGKFTPKMDWESIRGKPRVNSVLIAHMPTESSAVASGVTNGLYPPRKVVINKKSRKGVVQFICKGFEKGKNLLAWDVDNVTLSRYYSAVQDWSDQGISADTYFDPRKFENGKKPLSLLLKEWVAHFKLGNKSMYYVNTYDDDEVSIFDLIQSVEVQEADCESCKL